MLNINKRFGSFYIISNFFKTIHKYIEVIITNFGIKKSFQKISIFIFKRTNIFINFTIETIITFCSSINRSIFKLRDSIKENFNYFVNMPFIVSNYTKSICKLFKLIIGSIYCISVKLSSFIEIFTIRINCIIIGSIIKAINNRCYLFMISNFIKESFILKKHNHIIMIFKRSSINYITKITKYLRTRTFITHKSLNSITYFNINIGIIIASSSNKIINNNFI